MCAYILLNLLVSITLLGGREGRRARLVRSFEKENSSFSLMMNEMFIKSQNVQGNILEFGFNFNLLVILY